jgi:signal peptidase II
MNMSQKNKAILLFSAIIFLDQFVKIWVKSTMWLGQEHHVFGNWFIIHFTENNGMAYGMEFGGSLGKILLSIFRLFAISAIGWYIYRLIKKGTSTGVILGFTAIMAGAFGNIIDSALYGLFYGPSDWFQVAQFMPKEGGYAHFLYGKVVDMLYFPLIDTTLPKWFPFMGGEHFLFFQPVFNVADSAITCSVVYMLLFQRKFFKE